MNQPIRLNRYLVSLGSVRVLCKHCNKQTYNKPNQTTQLTTTTYIRIFILLQHRIEWNRSRNQNNSLGLCLFVLFILDSFVKYVHLRMFFSCCYVCICIYLHLFISFVNDIIWFCLFFFVCFFVCLFVGGAGWYRMWCWQPNLINIQLKVVKMKNAHCGTWTHDLGLIRPTLWPNWAKWAQ